MLKKITLLTLLIFSLVTLAIGQSAPWTLEQCISYARQNSINVKRALNSAELASINDLGNRMQRLPSLNANLGMNLQFGRTINPATNEFVASNFTGGSSSISAGLTVYNGNAINNSIKQGKLDMEAALLDADAAANDISLLVASAYLNILLSEEQLNNAQKQLEQSTKQLEQTDRLIAAGSLPANDRLDFVAQIALNEQTIIEAQNQVNINYLTIKQILELDPSVNLQIARPEVNVPEDATPELFRLEEVYTAALGTQPQIQADIYRLQSAELQERLARSQGLPRISIGASLSTNFSSLDQNEFTRQLSNNFGQSVGMNISIPIYNNHLSIANMQRAKVNYAQTNLINKQNKQNLKTDVQRALADARAAKESYEASLVSVEAAQAAYDNAQKRFNLGAINSLEFTTALNNLDRAQLTLIQSKFQYIFNLKVVDFYLGKEIRID